MSKNIVQLNNQYIQDENQRQTLFRRRTSQKKSFYGLGFNFSYAFVHLPTYNLVQSYQTLLERRQKLVELQEKYDELSKEKEYQENLSKRLKDDDYAAKYARAKYFYAKEGETIYNIPDLLPQ